MDLPEEIPTELDQRVQILPGLDIDLQPIDIPNIPADLLETGLFKQLELTMAGKGLVWPRCIDVVRPPPQMPTPGVPGPPPELERGC